MAILMLFRPRGLGHFVGGPRAISWWDFGDTFQRTGHAAKRAAKVRNVDDRKQETGDPEDMFVREQREQPKNGDNLELELL